MRKSIIFLVLGALVFSGAAVAQPAIKFDAFSAYIPNVPDDQQVNISGTIATTGDITVGSIWIQKALFTLTANHDNSSGTATVKYVRADQPNSYCILTISEPFAPNYPTVTSHNCVGNLTYSGMERIKGNSIGSLYDLRFDKIPQSNLK